MMTTKYLLNFTNEDSFELIDRVATRSAKSIYNQWVLAIDNAVHKEKLIIKRIEQLAMYFDTIIQDEYLINLYLICLGCKGQKDSMGHTIEKMERVRILILKNISRKNKKGFPIPELSQHIYDSKPETKTKFILRFATIKKVTHLLFEKLMAERSKKGLPVLEPEDCLNNSPNLLMKKLNDLVG